MNPCILLLEDDPAIAEAVAFAFTREGWGVEVVNTLAQARRTLQRAVPQLAVLDVGLPDGSGLDLCRELRSAPATQQLPLLMLSARSEELDRVLGLELGADDYVAKPFGTRELVARVRALLRRSQGAPTPQRGFVLEGDRVRFEGQRLDLTRLELQLLQRLLAAPTRIHTREALLDAVWGLDAQSSDRTVDTHIKTLRAKLRAVAPEADPIQTHRGLGYSLRG